MLRATSTSVCACLCVGLVCVPSSGWGAWFDSWAYRERIVIDHTRAPSDLRDFPLLISLNGFRSRVFAEAQPDGDDILFAPSDDGPPLSYEIEKFSAETGGEELIAWVRIPLFSAATDTVVYMYYGNSAAFSRQSSSGVWDEHYVLVQHWAETTGIHRDSTAYGNAGIPSGGANQDFRGLLDGGDAFDGVSGKITVPNALSLDDFDSFTISAWVRSTAAHVNDAIVVRGPYIWGTIKLAFLRGNLVFEPVRGEGGAVSARAVNDGLWHLLAGVYDGPGKIGTVFIDGNEDGSWPSLSSSPGKLTGLNWYIAARADELYHRCVMDEIRISNIPRSAAWLLASYRNQSNPNGFYRVESPQTAPTATPTPIPTASPNPTATGTRSPAATPSPSPSASPTPSPSATSAPSPSPPPSSSPTPDYPPKVHVLASGDYNGDGTSDIALFRPSPGQWFVRGVTRLYFGTAVDLPAIGDYDGDGVADIGIFRGAAHLWAIRNITKVYGGSEFDLPVPLDFTGDGSCRVAVFRRSTGLWFVRDLTRFYFGLSGDWPVPGDYTGDGTADFALFRPGSGLWAVRNFTRMFFGSNGDLGVAGDYNGDKKWQAAIFRLASGLWAIRGSSRIYFGINADLPIPADYDGDATDDVGIFRDSEGLWSVKAFTRVRYGTTGDIPVTR